MNTEKLSGNEYKSQDESLHSMDEEVHNIVVEAHTEVAALAEGIEEWEDPDDMPVEWYHWFLQLHPDLLGGVTLTGEESKDDLAEMLGERTMSGIWMDLFNEGMNDFNTIQKAADESALDFDLSLDFESFARFYNDLDDGVRAYFPDSISFLSTLSDLGYLEGETFTIETIFNYADIALHTSPHDFASRVNYFDFILKRERSNHDFLKLLLDSYFEAFSPGADDVFDMFENAHFCDAFTDPSPDIYVQRLLDRGYFFAEDPTEVSQDLYTEIYDPEVSRGLSLFPIMNKSNNGMQKLYAHVWDERLAAPGARENLESMMQTQRDEEVPYHLRFQDMTILTMSASDQAVVDLYQDRSQLVTEVETMYDVAPSPRQIVSDYESYRPWLSPYVEDMLPRLEFAASIADQHPEAFRTLYELSEESYRAEDLDPSELTKEERENRRKIIRGYKQAFRNVAQLYGYKTPEEKEQLYDAIWNINSAIRTDEVSGSEKYDLYLKELDAMRTEVREYEEDSAEHVGANEYVYHYCERPEVSELPSVKLLQIHALKQSLESEATLQNIGDLMWEDINIHTDTEVGGRVELDLSDGQFSFQLVKKLKFREGQHNGAYLASLTNSQFHPDGAFNFHFHATQEDDSQYSGPSGYATRHSKYNKGGDMNMASSGRANELVFTAMGHPKDAEGNEITDRLLVNLDFYWAEDDKTKPEVTVFDMGVFEVPYQKPE